MMDINLTTLRRFTPVPHDARQARVLLDEVGLEVKRIDPSDPDVPVTLELLANRGDHHCYVGLAREVSGRTGGSVCFPSGIELTEGTSPHPVFIESALCSAYTITMLERTGTGVLEAEALSLLESAGLKSVGAVVDATNVSNLELGQPTHAFDADTIVGPIRIRLARAGEQAWPLFATEKVTLPEGALVIADDAKVLAIAGVIGCEESKTTDATTRVLLESAAFDPVAVRKASRALSIHTDSSARFERGSDFSMPLVGAGRVAALLAHAGWVVRGETGVVGAWEDPKRTVRFDPASCRRFLAIDEPDAMLSERLRRYGFGLAEADGALMVSVPPHRLWDVEFSADLYEEIAKSIGYDNTPTALPVVDMGALPSDRERALEVAEEVLLGHGFYEVITDGFYGRVVQERLGLGEDDALWSHVETANALDRAYSLLKNNCLAQAVEGVASSIRRQHREVKAYEVTRTFHPDASAANGVCTERDVLWGIVSGHATPPGWSGKKRAADALFLKGVVAEMAVALGLDLTFGALEEDTPLAVCLHPNRCIGIRLDGRQVGLLGEVHPRVLDAYKVKRARPTYLEIAVDALCGKSARPPFVEPSRFNPAVRNLAFTLPHRVQETTWQR
jgi:phenylalanyl-tRNA synthetase beta chain